MNKRLGVTGKQVFLGRNLEGVILDGPSPERHCRQDPHTEEKNDEDRDAFLHAHQNITQAESVKPSGQRDRERGQDNPLKILGIYLE